jgi:hypothetical protein
MTPMKSDLRRLAAAAVLSLHCGGTAPEPAAPPTPGAPPPTAAEANPAMAQPRAPLRPVTEDEFNRCVAMLTEAREAAKAGGPNGPSEYMALLQKHGFVQPTFMEVHQNLSLAYGAIVNVERLAAMPKPGPQPVGEGAGAPAAPPANAFGEIPPENIELLRARRAEFEAAVGK